MSFGTSLALNFEAFKNNDLTGDTTSHYEMDRDGFKALDVSARAAFPNARSRALPPAAAMLRLQTFRRWAASTSTSLRITSL
jgi:hypothetical protein